MCKSEHYTFIIRTVSYSNTWVEERLCPIFIIALFRLIKRMVIPRGEIREGEYGCKTKKPDKAFVSHWAAKRAAALCPLEDIFNMVDMEIVLQQRRRDRELLLI